jgi:hypothetical protein
MDGVKQRNGCPERGLIELTDNAAGTRRMHVDAPQAKRIGIGRVAT